MIHKNQDQHKRFLLIVEKKAVGRCNLFFLDSGAFSMKVKAAAYARKHQCSRWRYYDTREFWKYCDHYAEFVKRYRSSIDFYANVDAIGSPELSWRNQQYFEKTHGLRPVPVVHCRSPIFWIKRYMDEGHDLIGLGGGLDDWEDTWLNRAFDLVCPKPDRVPVVRMHGFAMTSYHHMIRYPWWSVDSATWTKVGAFGSILVPHKRDRHGGFTFAERPYQIAVSHDSPGKNLADKHYYSLRETIKDHVDGWLSDIKVPLGEVAPDGTIVQDGVITTHSQRKIANLRFFDRLIEWIGPYPREFCAGETAFMPGFGIGK